MLNFLYCFDKTYNKQASVSIFSLLENSSEKINIFVIHKYESFIDELEIKILNHKKLNDLNCYQFKESNIKFPNIANSHISEATYYRLFLSNYIPKNLKNIVYLDADTVCLKDPIKILKETYSKMESSYSISALTEFNLYPETERIFNNLGMKNSKYFNAGVMIIDLNMWKKQDIENLAQLKMSTMVNKINFWDQDILNSILDGNFQELDKNLNYIVKQNNDINFKAKFKNNKSDLPFFLHYAGSNKPWSFIGILEPSSDYYHSYYRKLFKEKYHIVIIWKKLVLKQLFRSLINLKIFFKEYSLRLIFIVLKKIFKG